MRRCTYHVEKWCERKRNSKKHKFEKEEKRQCIDELVMAGIGRDVQMERLHETVHEFKDMKNCMAACVALHLTDVERMHVHVYATKLAKCHVG